MGTGPTVTVGYMVNGVWTPASATNPLPVAGIAPTTAGLNTLGFVKGIFIPNGGTLPTPLPIYTLVIEQE